MKKLVIPAILLLGCFALAGCNQFGGLDQTSEQTTDSSTLQADQTDITNSSYTLKVRKDMNLISGQITFTDNKMEWVRTYAANEAETSSSSEIKTTLTAVKISTDTDNYTISGKENGKEVSIHFTKVGNYRIKDEEGNIYSL